jgi:hypothetical protein
MNKKSKIYNILHNNMMTPTPQQKGDNMYNNNGIRNNKKIEQEQEQRRHLLEEYKREKEVKKKNTQLSYFFFYTRLSSYIYIFFLFNLFYWLLVRNNKVKDKQTSQKKTEKEKLLSRRITTITNIETKNEIAYPSPTSSLYQSNLDKYQTPPRKPVKSLSLNKSKSLKEVQDDTLPSSYRNKPVTSFTSSQSRNNTKNQIRPLVHFVSKKPQGSTTISPITRKVQRTPLSLIQCTSEEKSSENDVKYDDTGKNTNSIVSLTILLRSMLKHSPDSNNIVDEYQTPHRKPVKSLSLNKSKSSTIEASSTLSSPYRNKPVTSFTSSQSRDNTKNQIRPLVHFVSKKPQGSTTISPITRQVQRTPLSLIQCTPEEKSSENDVKYDDTGKNTNSIISLTILLRSMLKHSPDSNDIVDDDDKDFLTPKASDYTKKVENFFSALSSTPYREFINYSDESTVGRNSSAAKNLEVSGRYDSFKMYPYKDISIQTSPYLLDRFYESKSQEILMKNYKL